MQSKYKLNKKGINMFKKRLKQVVSIIVNDCDNFDNYLESEYYTEDGSDYHTYQAFIIKLVMKQQFGYQYDSIDTNEVRDLVLDCIANK